MLGYNRWHLIKLLAVILCVATIVWIVLAYFFPAPPSKIKIAGSFKGGHYEFLANRYKEILARSNVEVEVVSTDGAVENLKLLNDPNSGIQIGFMQGGISDSKHAPDLLSLGRINYQPLWLFSRAIDTWGDLTQLKGKRIAVGPAGSGARYLSEKILAKSGITPETATLLPLAAQGAVKALGDGTIDALFLVFTPDSPILQSLLKNPSFRPISLARSEALTRIFPFVVRLVVPQGAIDYEKNIPAADLNIVATTNVVLVRNEIHPALIDLLAQTIMEFHNEAGLLHRAGDFPTHTDAEYPIAESARDFYKSGPSFLNRYIPFWMATYAQRFFAILLTVIAIVLPLNNYLPRLYGWIVKSYMAKLHRRLRGVETELQTELTATQVVVLQGELESIDQAASVLPMRHSDLFLSVKGHIERTRSRLASRVVELQSRMAKVA